jgi:Ser/Thr protein kinase RdoA (MazF antagonist)
MSAAPQTGHQTVEDSIVNEALGLFFEFSEKLQLRKTTGGVNNVCLYVDQDDQHYILRIYNNGNNSAKVAFEHDILAQLQVMQQNAETKLSYEVPNALPSRNGRAHELLSSGAECCVFHIISGQLASTTSPEEVGRATGELSAALGSVKINSASPTHPYA